MRRHPREFDNRTQKQRNSIAMMMNFVKTFQRQGKHEELKAMMEAYPQIAAMMAKK
ncbi:hypothetical protein D3C86_2250470 [compost metagenome]